MSIYAIGDLHLPGNHIKPMDIFGAEWENHFDKISADWRARVRSEDIVLLPGDFSWAMTLDEAMSDIEAVSELPGRKLMCRGNHDYWWSSVTQVRSALPKDMYVVQNDAMILDGVIYCGTRGWTVPPTAAGAESEIVGDSRDIKLYRRELIRMELALQNARRLSEVNEIIVLTHYPPFDEQHSPSDMTGLFERYGVRRVVYGHLHGQSLKGAFSGMLGGVEYHQVSCDGLGFKLKQII